MPSKRLISNTSTTIYQPIEKVWDTISNFHDLSWCPNVVSNCVPMGEVSGNTTGAKRVVNDAFHERLRAHTSSTHMIGYIIENGPPPISSNDVHIQISLSQMTDDVTHVALNVSSSAENSDSNNFCTTTCISMFDDLRKTLQ